MKQAYMPEAEVIKYREVEIPVPKDSEVLIKVSKIGICGSDLHVFEGKHPLVSFPLVQGHEFSGYVAEAGKDVTKAKPGDLVVVQPAIGCGHCKRCGEGVFAQCDNLQFIGGALHGGGSEYFAVDERQIIKLKEGVKPEDAAMIEPLSVAVHNVKRMPDITGQTAMIMGAGTIGNLTAQVAKHFGAGDVHVFDINEDRINIARACGLLAHHSKEAPEIFGDNLANVSFECVGKEIPLNSCIELTERGGYVIVPGVYSGDPSVRMIRVQDAEINMLGSLMYTWDDYFKAVDLVEKNEVDLAPLRTHIIKFDQWLEGYHMLQNPKSGALKVIIDLD